MAAADLTYIRALFRFHYDGATGLLTWQRPFKHSARVPGDQAGTVCLQGYVMLTIRGKHYPVHRVIWLMVTGEWPRGEIDHINGVRNDNRWLNLRDVPTAINQQNQRKAQRGSRSGLLGAYPNPGSASKPWKALIKPLDEKLLHLGSFATPQEAHEAYLKAKRTLHEGCTL